MTREEALMLSAYTGVPLVPDFEDVHRYCRDILLRVWNTRAPIMNSEEREMLDAKD